MAINLSCKHVLGITAGLYIRRAIYASSKVVTHSSFLPPSARYVAFFILYSLQCHLG
jgi:hypothetical protein